MDLASDGTAGRTPRNANYVTAYGSYVTRLRYAIACKTASRPTRPDPSAPPPTGTQFLTPLDTRVHGIATATRQALSGSASQDRIASIACAARVLIDRRGSGGVPGFACERARGAAARSCDTRVCQCAASSLACRISSLSSSVCPTLPGKTPIDPLHAD